MVRFASVLIGVVLAAVLAGLPVRAEVLIGAAGPMTSKYAWLGEQMQRGVEQAVADLNAAGGVLGQEVQLTLVDDACDAEQAVAAADKLVSQAVTFVVGHFCSHASIPASAVYEAAGVLQISPASSNPALTELGRANVFRIVSRDDANGRVAGNYLADHWPDEKIAVLHDGTTYGEGVAEQVKMTLNERGLTEARYSGFVPGGSDYAPEVDALQAAHATVLFIGGYHTEIALIAREAYDRSYRVHLVTSGTLATEEFGLIAGPASEGVLFLDVADPRRRAEAAPVVERLRASGFEPEGYTLYAYAAVQVWAEAVGRAGSVGLDAVIGSLRRHQFDTVLGLIDFDRSDLTVQKPVWYIWRGGQYMLLEERPAACLWR